jgi:hypothetical protein
MLFIKVPNQCAPEVNYALDIILGEFIGISYQVKGGAENMFRLEYEGRELTLDCSFFSALALDQVDGLTRVPVAVWDSRETGWQIPLIDPLVPVLFGQPSITQSDSHIHIGLDIFGAAFFMLSRYEETVNAARDRHGCFPLNEALEYRHDFLLRPIIDEYVEILWAAMRQLWPRIERKQRSFEIVPTHDLDDPYLGPRLVRFGDLVRRLGGDLLRRRAPLLALRTADSYLRSKRSGPYRPMYDPYDTHDWLMRQSERSGVAGRFYFMSDLGPDPVYGGRYDIETPHILDLMKAFAARGHEIGIHPTSESFRDGTAFSAQVAHLRQAMEKCGIQQDILGGRQHYLRWQADLTPGLCEAAGMDYDSTLGHAEHVGFRCGTCHAYPLWDFKSRTPLQVKQHPLILMDDSLFYDHSMGLSAEQVLDLIKKLHDTVRKFDGRFVFLWHNSALMTHTDRSLYQGCLGDYDVPVS